MPEQTIEKLKQIRALLGMITVQGEQSVKAMTLIYDLLRSLHVENTEDKTKEE